MPHNATVFWLLAVEGSESNYLYNYLYLNFFLIITINFSLLSIYISLFLLPQGTVTGNSAIKFGRKRKRVTFCIVVLYCIVAMD